MKTRELIAELLKLDPTGELQVFSITGDCDEIHEASVSEIWVESGVEVMAHSPRKTKACPIRAIWV